MRRRMIDFWADAFKGKTVRKDIRRGGGLEERGGEGLLDGGSGRA